MSILSLIMGPDKEAVLVFAAVGCYPILKPFFERWNVGLILKLAYFNIMIIIVYAIMIYVLGMQDIAAENAEFGVLGLVILFTLGNATFLLLDRLLSIMEKRFR